jgi:tetratricopeptide (TPR) repeat protein
MLEPHSASLLVGYYESFLRDQNIDAFRQNVSARYTEGTLCRLLQSGTMHARRAAVLALGLTGSFQVNATVAKALRDEDMIVRSLAQSALWAIWFRADSPEHNATLEQVHDLNGRGRHREAEALATQLIGAAPRFAEAYNQRAIALYLQGRIAESAADCRRVLERNPYHFGALSGLGQCYIKLGRRRDALDTFRRALKIQPQSEDLKETVERLEANPD